MWFKILEASWIVLKTLLWCWVVWAVVTQDAIKINYIDDDSNRACVCVSNSDER